MSGEGRDQHMTTNFNSSFFFPLCLVLLTPTVLGSHTVAFSCFLKFILQFCSSSFAQSTSPHQALSHLHSLQRGVKLSAIPATIRFFYNTSLPSTLCSILTFSLSLDFFFHSNSLTQASFIAGNQAFSDCCCTLLEKN